MIENHLDMLYGPAEERFVPGWSDRPAIEGWTAENVHGEALTRPSYRDSQHWMIRVAEPPGEWRWPQLRDGLVDVGRIPLDAAIYRVIRLPREGHVLISFASKVGPASSATEEPA